MVLILATAPPIDLRMQNGLREEDNRNKGQGIRKTAVQREEEGQLGSGSQLHSITELSGTQFINHLHFPVLTNLVTEFGLCNIYEYLRFLTPRKIEDSYGKDTFQT